MTPKQNALLEQCHPVLLERISVVLGRLGGRMVPISAHRSPGQQAAIYQFGRTRIAWAPDWSILSGGEVIKGQRTRTKAAPMQSAHNFDPARAIDCVLNTALVDVGERDGVADAWCTSTKQAADTWREYGALVVEVGLVWGGSWKMRDMPHAELPEFRSERWG
jgi:hypothetical protein